MTLHCDDVLKTQVAALLGGGALKIERLPTSGNNRLYIIDSGKDRFVAKHYFAHAEDKRDRLHAEYSFVTFARRNGIDCVPRPIACDANNHLAIYSLVEGRKFGKTDVTKSAISAALGFLAAINKYRDKVGKDLPDAAEACFSIAAHVDLVENRIRRLSAITEVCVGAFVKEELVPGWENIKKVISSRVGAKGMQADAVLPQRDRIISPSDFGFHNCLIGEGGVFNFLDFEYAGWDDPAKTAGDFFSHLALPVPVDHLGVFARGIADLTSDPVQTRLRIGLLLPLYRIKWCCIALNDFLPMDSERRKFAGIDVDEAKDAQLAKARGLLVSMERLTEASHGLH